MSFGNLAKGLRIAQRKTLRQFCLEIDFDPSNWSKIERDVSAPPKDMKILSKFARHLGLVADTEEWKNFMLQADIARGEIPREIINDKALLAKLPVFFRTVRGAELDEAKLDNLIEKIRKAHSSDDK